MKKSTSILIIIVLLLVVTACDNTVSIPGNKVKVISLSATPNNLILYSGQIANFKLEALMNDGNSKDLASTNNFSYRVSEENTISIDSGYIKAANKAIDSVVTVSFSSGDLETSIDINIKENPITAFTLTEEGDAVVKDATRLDIIVNKSLHLSKEYIPDDLVIPAVAFPESYTGSLEKMHFRQESAAALENMFTAAKDEGLELCAISGYRSYSLQDRIFKYQTDRHGSVEEANKISAKPGQSEHQTGLAMDISCKSIDFKLKGAFAETEEGKWLFDNCAKYGFILRYLKGKEEITGYSYEPWHFRYVGVELAEVIMAEKITLEEYFNQLNNE